MITSATDNINDTTRVFKSHINNIKAQCDLIKNDICSSVKKNNIDDVTPSEIQNCRTLKKELIADYLLSMVNLSDTLCRCDYICKYFDQLDATKSENTNTDSQLATCRAITDAVEKSLKQHTENMGQKFNELSNIINTNRLNYVSSPPPVSEPDLCNMNMASAPEPEISDHKPHFITVEEQEKLMNFLSGVEFVQENGHSVKHFGAHYKITVILVLQILMALTVQFHLSLVQFWKNFQKPI